MSLTCSHTHFWQCPPVMEAFQYLGEGSSLHSCRVYIKYTSSQKSHMSVSLFLPGKGTAMHKNKTQGRSECHYIIRLLETGKEFPGFCV